jgi:acyl-coenzyme A synthetase/AMP-(fatty) acid ligase
MRWLLERIRNYGSGAAIIDRGREYSYHQLYEEIERRFYSFKSHIPKGATVALLSDYSFDSIAEFLALVMNSNIIIPITTTVEDEIDERLTYAEFIIRSAASVPVVNSEAAHHELIEKLKKEDKPGLILYSSGSTGRPKAMIHDLEKLIGSYQHRKEKDLVFLVFLMFDHIGGLNTLFNCLSMGITLCIPASREPSEICRLIEKYRVNIFPSTPTFLNLILISGEWQKHDMSSLKMITYGTEPVTPALLSRIKDAFPHVKLLQTFGTSETGIVNIKSKSSLSSLVKIDDPNTEYRIVEGELWLRSGTQVLGYLNAGTEQFTPDGWFRTGDMVEEADDGYLKITGRKNDIINVGGQKVFPAEVESVLLEIENIRDATVFGKPNPITGNMVAASVVLDEPEPVDQLKKKIRLYCKDKLDAYKIPVDIRIMEAIGTTARFKKIRELK